MIKVYFYRDGKYTGKTMDVCHPNERINLIHAPADQAAPLLESDHGYSTSRYYIHEIHDNCGHRFYIGVTCEYEAQQAVRDIQARIDRYL